MYSFSAVPLKLLKMAQLCFNLVTSKSDAFSETTFDPIYSHCTLSTAPSMLVLNLLNSRILIDCKLFHDRY